ncbi:hypothetical protein DOS71_04470 [Staphylococcus felis]|nr:hypothetical protein DOS71_04470 [Staphylococcus felis]
MIVHNPLNNTADARGRIKVGREKKNKSRSKSNYSSRKDSRSKTNKKLKQIKSILLVRNIKGEK